MDYVDYREKLGIGFNEKEKQKVFINRIQVFLKAHGTSSFNEKQERAFCYAIAEQCSLDNNPLFEINFDREDPTGYQRVWLYLKKKTDCFPDFLAALMIFANGYCGGKANSHKVIKTIKNAMDDSHLHYEVYNDKDGVFLFPHGVKEMDHALVSEPLEWLSGYPDARTAFVKALREYADQTEDNASNIADKFRKALETFMQEFFDTEKSLENCKAPYGSYLKKQGVPAEIAGNLETLLQAYTNYINNYAKHKDKTQSNVLEYLLYQTGNIIRLLITLKNGEEKNAD